MAVAACLVVLLIATLSHGVFSESTSSRRLNTVNLLPGNCDDKYCTSNGNDCCAPYMFDEPATCSGNNSYKYPYRLGTGCGGLWSEGTYTCCKEVHLPKEVPAAGVVVALGFLLSLSFYISCCCIITWGESAYKHITWPVGVLVMAITAVSWHIGFLPILAGAAEQQTYVTLGKVGGGLGIVFGYIACACWLPQLLRRRWGDQPPCKREGCKFRKHPLQTHGFCCSKCEKNEGHGCRCHKQEHGIEDKTSSDVEAAAVAGVVVAEEAPAEPQANPVIARAVAGQGSQCPPLAQISTAGADAALARASQYPPLAQMCDTFKRDVGVKGSTMEEVISAACIALGVEQEGRTLMEKAQLCWQKVYGQAHATATASAVTGAVVIGQPLFDVSHVQVEDDLIKPASPKHSE